MTWFLRQMMASAAVFSGAISGGVLPVPTLVQAVASTVNDNNGINGNDYQFNAPNLTLAGNCLVLTLSYPYSASRSISIVDSNGDTWPAAAVTKGAASTGNMNTSIFVLPNASAGLHTLTITFDASFKPFKYSLQEFYNVATSSPVDGTTGINSVAGTAANAGSFTPSTNNDANGGHLIFLHGISNDTVGANNALEASSILPTNGAKLLHADNTATIPSFSTYGVQAVNGANNPGAVVAQSSGTNFVLAGIALKAANAGTAPGPGIRVVRLIHATCQTQASNTFLFPCDGNLRVATLAAGSDLIGAASITDSEGNTYNSRGAASQPQVFDNDGLTRTPSNSLTMTVTASSGMASVHLWDIAGADPTAAFMNATGIYTASPGSGSVCNDLPDHTPNANVKGLTIAQTGFGTAGPQFGFASGAPAVAIFDDVFYTGMSDSDLMDNADPFGHFYFNDNTPQTWNWKLGAAGHGSTAFATAASYKSA